MTAAPQNPLAKHFRQPKVYIRLPSGGEYYEGGIEKTESGEYPVLAMTARDEIMYKTPDALLNGQATVDVIQSCVPNIKDAWRVPNIDLDVILLGIRIASVGEKMEVGLRVPGLDEERSYEVNLRTLLDQIYAQTYENIVKADSFTIELRPTSYKYFTELALKTFEEQRIFSLLNNNNITEQQKIERIQSSFKKLTDINLDLVKNSILSVQWEDETPVTDRNHINEFIDNADGAVFDAIIKHVESQKDRFGIKPLKVKFSKEDQAAGAPAELDVPITLDQSNFFGKGS